MSEKTVRLTGFKALLVLVVILGAVVFRVATARSKLDTQGRLALEAWVRGEVIRPILADTTRSMLERGAAVVQAAGVKIREIAVRGPLDGAVARVELEPNPAFPPDTELVRYYRVRYSEITGWTHAGRANVFAWYLAAF